MPDIHPASDETVVALEPEAGGGPAEVSHTLVVTDEGGGVRRVAVGAAPLVLGRVPPCGLVLPDRSVSREHCRAELRGGELVVTDLGSTNGTHVDGRRIATPTVLQHGAALAVGRFALSYERRTVHEIEEAAALDRDLEEASAYLRALLPQPLTSGPVRTSWLFRPCARLGGCGFGAGFLGPDRFLAYALNVAGHGTSAAMQAVSLMSLLARREPALADPREPAAVIAALAAGSEARRGASFGLWYGVLDLPTRRLRHAAAGHAPALLAGADGSVSPLGGDAPVLGLGPAVPVAVEETVLPPGSVLHLVGDGVSEMLDRAGLDPLSVLGPALRDGAEEVPAPLRLYRAARHALGSEAMEEDFAALTLCVG